jgi:hypothetical protein
MDRDELVESLTSDVLAYVMGGSFPDRHFAREIKPEGLDERFDEFEKLVRLHFLLQPDVVDFVERLPENLRSIKTQTKNVSRISRGTVDGRIDWGATVQERYSRNPGNNALFVCEHRSESYDIDENLVLKKLLSLIYETLSECAVYFQRDYEWVTERWRDNSELVEQMQRIFERNVHVRRIRSPEDYEPTERMLQRAGESRQNVYRTAASLLRDYRAMIEGDPDAMKQLLSQTAITPDDDETLFELFVLFRYISVIEELSTDEFTLRTIESGSQEVARLSNADGESIVLYHDDSAKDRGISFVSDIGDKERVELSRTETIHREAYRTANAYFDDSEFTTATGRPDVIVLEIDRAERTEYLITEVKHSTRPETIRSGIKETLEYLAFLRDGGDLVHDSDEMFGSGWNGVLVTQDLESVETAELHDQRTIRILQASELEEKLETVLQRVL